MNARPHPSRPLATATAQASSPSPLRPHAPPPAQAAPSRQGELFARAHSPNARADTLRADGTQGDRRRGTGDRRASTGHTQAGHPGPARGDRRAAPDDHHPDNHPDHRP